jgi:hypothetical protein
MASDPTPAVCFNDSGGIPRLRASVADLVFAASLSSGSSSPDPAAAIAAAQAVGYCLPNPANGDTHPEDSPENP